MTRKFSIYLVWLAALLTLSAMILFLSRPSWSSPAVLFVTTSTPSALPTATGAEIVLNGGGFSPLTKLWLVTERSLRTATSATLETFGYPQHFVHRDDHLFVANGVGGFLIVQELQAPTPSISGILNSEGQGMEIVLHQDEAIMAAGMSGLQIIDIRDDVNPQLLAELKSVAPALSVASTGKIAYVATGQKGVQIVDLTDKRSPRRLGRIPNLPAAYKVISDKELLIVATGRGGIVYDLRNPEEPRRLAQLPVAGMRTTVMAHQGATLFWAAKTLQGNHLYAIDLSRPASPRLLTSIALNGIPSGISCSGEQIAVALGSSGTQIFSWQDNARFTLFQTIAAKNRSRFVLPLGNDLWIGDGNGELLRLNSQQAKALTKAPLLPDFSPRIPLLITPQLLLLGDENGLAIYDRSDDSAPTLLARLAITGLVQQYLTANQQQLWLAIRNHDPLASGKLLCVDISIPQAPRITAEIPLPYSPKVVGEFGTTLIVSTATPAYIRNPILALIKTDIWNAGAVLIKRDISDALYFIDMSISASPSPVWTSHLTMPSSGLAITDQFLLMMQEDGLFRVIDLSEGQALKELGSLQMPWLQTSAWSGPVDIAVKAGVAFISSRLGRIVAIDLKNPRQPINLGILSLKGPVSSLVQNDQFLLAMVEKEGLTVIDINNPREPKALGTIPLPGFLHIGMIQSGSFWYVMSATNGIHSIPLPHPLQVSVAGSNQLSARLDHSPPAGAYRFWLNDQQNHTLLPGVTWFGPQP